MGRAVVRRIVWGIVLGWIGLAAGPGVGLASGPRLGLFRQVAGELRTVEVRPGDTLIGIASRVGVPWRTLAAENDVERPDRIYPGQRIRLDTRRVVPAVLENGWVINVPEATLYVFEGGRVTARYPVGLGRPARPTPLGSFTILFREEDPTWDVPPSIQEEMRREGVLVRRRVPPGPDNPLGRYWIQLSLWGYGIHGTPFGTSVGQFLSHGCIRAGDAEIADLYARAAQGLRVDIVYLPVKVAVTPGGEVWAEAHPDVYGLGFPSEGEVWAALAAQGVAEHVDRGALGAVLDRKEGVARQVGKVPDPNGGDEAAEGGDGLALWQCLDCPPDARRRVTFQVEARAPIDLPNPYPIEVRDDTGRVVFRPQMVAQSTVHLEPGETRNFVWEVRDTLGQPLPAGSYRAVIRYFPAGGDGPRELSLPLWVGQ